MNITIKRLSEFKVAQVKAVSDALKNAIHTLASTWVCQALQQPQFWGAETLKSMAERDALGIESWTWVALVGTKPAGLCFVHQEGEDRRLALFLVDTRYTQAEQWEIADAIALRGIADVLADKCPAKRNMIGWFPEKGWAADYARRCGFKSERVGTYMGVIPETNPILLWTTDMRQLQANIEAMSWPK